MIAKITTTSPNTEITDFLKQSEPNPAWHRHSCRAGVRLVAILLFLLALATWTGAIKAALIPVPNMSFESPETSFADPRMDGWQKAPQPAWYTGGENFPWDQLVGQFLNTTNGSPDHIDNMDGKQGAFLFALPAVAIFQDYDSISGINTSPTHDFNSKFEVGKSYALTVGVLGGGGGMSNGVPLEISLYYRDAGSNRVTVAATSITNTASLFPTRTHLTDFHVVIPPVKVSDAWANQYIGIRLASTVGFDLQGGYWDVDNVRMDVAPLPVLTGLGVVNGQFRFTLESGPGRFDILASPDVGLLLSTWSVLGTVTNFTGSILFTDTNSPVNRRFYQARQSP